jgi:uncharacterized protein
MNVVPLTGARLRRLRLVLFFVAVYTLLCCVSGVFIADATLHPGRRPLLGTDQIQAGAMTQRHNSHLREVEISAFDGISLRAWEIRPARENGKAIILFHGLSDNRMGMIGYAEMLVNHGYTVLLPDARAHGTSGGELATYGLWEADDIHRWLDWLQQNEQPNCVFGLGESMGAAQLLQSLKDHHGFCAVVGESPFSDFREIAYDRVGQYFHTGPWLGKSLLRPVVEAAFLRARWKYGLQLDEVSPQQALARTSIPVLLIHGQQDGNISVRHSRAIAAHNLRIVLWEVPGADHCGANSTAHERFEQKLLEWYDTHPLPKSAISAN